MHVRQHHNYYYGLFVIYGWHLLHLVVNANICIRRHVLGHYFYYS